MAEGTAVANAYVTIGADDSELMNSLAALQSKLTTPLTGAARVMKDILTRSLSGVGQSLTDALKGDLPRSVGDLARTATDVVGGTTRVAGRELGSLAGDALQSMGTLAAGATSMVSHAAGQVLGFAGEGAKAVTGAIGGVLDFIPIVGPALGGLTRMAGGAVSGVFSLLGNLVTGLGDLTANAIKGVSDMAANMARTVIPLIGSIAGDLIQGVGNSLAGLASKIGGAVLNPVKAAMDHSLTDLDHWTDKAIKAETGIARFKATLATTGATAGWTGEQLGKMMANMQQTTPFSKGDIGQSMTELLRMDQVRGDVFKRALEDSGKLAQFMGTDMAGAAGTLGLALQNPEHGITRLQRSTHLFNQAELTMLEQAKATGNTLTVQTMILDILEKKLGDVSKFMEGTVEDKLARLHNAWNSLGSGIGKIFAPLSGAAAEVATTIVNLFSGGVTPTLKEFAETTKSWAASISQFLKDNQGTFDDWSATISVIVGNIKNLLGGALQGLMDQLNPGAAGDFWDTFKDGVSGALAKLAVLTSNWDIMKEAANVAWLGIKAMIGDVVDWGIRKVKEWWEKLKEFAMPIIDKVATYLKDTFLNAVLAVLNKVNTVGVNALTGNAVSKAIAEINGRAISGMDQSKGGMVGLGPLLAEMEKQGIAEEDRTKFANEALKTGKLPTLPDGFKPSDEVIGAVKERMEAEAPAANPEFVGPPAPEQSAARSEFEKARDDFIERLKGLNAATQKQIDDEKALRDKKKKEQQDVGKPKGPGPANPNNLAIGHSGFEELSKKIQEGLGGTPIDANTKATEENTEALKNQSGGSFGGEAEDFRNWLGHEISDELNGMLDNLDLNEGADFGDDLGEVASNTDEMAGTLKDILTAIQNQPAAVGVFG